MDDGVKISEGDKAIHLERFEELTLPYVDAIYRTAYYLTHMVDEAEDLAQETYLRAYRAFGDFRGDNARAWLFAILRHAFLDNYRRDRRNPTLIDIDALESPNLDGQDTFSVDSAEEQLLVNLLDEDVQRALNALPPEWRLVILLADLEDFSYQEIASIMQMPIGTVMSRLHRGRKRLYELLHSYACAAGYLTGGRS